MVTICVLLLTFLAAGAARAQEVNVRVTGEPGRLVDVVDRDGNGVEDYFNPGNFPIAAEMVEIEINFGEDYDPDRDAAIVDSLLRLEATGGRVTTVLREVPVIWAESVFVNGAIVDTTSGEVLNASFRTILENTGATSIGAQRVYRVALSTSVRDVRAMTDPVAGVEGVWRWGGSGFVPDSTLATGRGVTVAILDSGVDNGFFNIQAGQVGYVDIPASDPGLNDPGDHVPSYHGTRLAAIATGLFTVPGLLGVAPEARIVDVNVATDSTGATTMKSIMEAFEWCVQNRNQVWPNADTSFAGIDLLVTGYVDGYYTPYGHIFQSGGNFGQACDPAYDPPDNAPINVLANKLVEKGIVVVAAAGNCGCDSLYDGGLGLLANAAKVIAVSAVNDWNTVLPDDDSVAPYSSYGDSLLRRTKPEISAPGTNIFQNTWNACGSPGDVASGTSFAAPHVAGAAALLLDRAPGISPDSVRTLLMNSAVDLGASGWDPGFGAGLLDCRAAIDLLP